MNFELISDYKPTGDQPEAIAQLTEGVLNHVPAQTLQGVTGSGKTFTIANVIKNVNKPTFQIDLQQPMTFEVVDKNKEFTVVREKDFIFLSSNRKYQKGEILNLEIWPEH